MLPFDDLRQHHGNIYGNIKNHVFSRVSYIFFLFVAIVAVKIAEKQKNKYMTNR